MLTASCLYCFPDEGPPLSNGCVQASSKEFKILATTLSLLDRGRYAGERIIDYLQIQEHKALLMTDQRVIFFDIRSHKAKAVVSYQGATTLAAWKIPAVLCIEDGRAFALDRASV